MLQHTKSTRLGDTAHVAVNLLDQWFDEPIWDATNSEELFVNFFRVVIGFVSHIYKNKNHDNNNEQSISVLGFLTRGEHCIVNGR